MNKALNKLVMDRSRLRNRYFKNRTPENRLAYTKIGNLCVSTFRKQKKAFFTNLDTKSVTDNKLFWKVIKPSFSDKAPKMNASHYLKMKKLFVMKRRFVRF